MLTEFNYQKDQTGYFDHKIKMKERYNIQLKVFITFHYINIKVENTLLSITHIWKERYLSIFESRSH